jgi:hypothetical protein
MRRERETMNEKERNVRIRFNFEAEATLDMHESVFIETFGCTPDEANDRIDDRQLNEKLAEFTGEADILDSGDASFLGAEYED